MEESRLQASWVSLQGSRRIPPTATLNNTCQSFCLGSLPGTQSSGFLEGLVTRAGNTGSYKQLLLLVFQATVHCSVSPGWGSWCSSLQCPMYAEQNVRSPKSIRILLPSMRKGVVHVWYREREREGGGGSVSGFKDRGSRAKKCRLPLHVYKSTDFLSYRALRRNPVLLTHFRFLIPAM